MYADRGEDAAVGGSQLRRWLAAVQVDPRDDDATDAGGPSALQDRGPVTIVYPKIKMAVGIDQVHQMT